MAHDLDALTKALLKAARDAGAEAADAIAVAGDTQSIEVRNGALEQAERAEGVDIGLRVLIGHRQAHVSASDTSARTIEEMAARAVAMAREAPEDLWCGLADPDQLARDWDVAVLELEDPSPMPDAAALKDAALRAEAAALGVPGISRMDAAGAGWSASRVHLAATNGFSGAYGRTGHSVQAVAICGEGLAMERDYAFESRVHQGDLPDPESIGRLAGERAASRAGAAKPPTGAWPVLYDERVASGLIGHLVQAVNGAMIARGSSWLKDAMGEAVLPDGVDLVEDPARARVSGSRPFDGEGLPVGPRACGERRAAELDSRSRDRPTARAREHRQRQPGRGRPAGTVGRQPDADAREAHPGGSDARDGHGAADHFDDGLFDQSQHRRLLAGRERLLGRKRRDHAAGERMHGRGQSARHAARVHGRQ